MISITERKRRYEDLAYAIGSCEMEGCIFTAETRKLYERYATEKIGVYMSEKDMEEKEGLYYSNS